MMESRLSDPTLISVEESRGSVRKLILLLQKSQLTGGYVLSFWMKKCAMIEVYYSFIKIC